MKTEHNILIAFILNFLFSIFEFVGGIITGSIAILSDSIHDIGDAISIGSSYFLEKKSNKQPDEKYTFGYGRFSILGALITTLILFLSSIFVVYNAINRIINPIKINYDGMIIFAIVGVIVNTLASHFTKSGDSINQKAVNLHMLEDVFGWIIVLIGAIIIRFTNILIIDPILSIIVAIFIFINSIKNLKVIIDLFLIKTPKNINLQEIKKHILEIDGVIDIHHIHIWTIDGQTNFSTMHIVSKSPSKELKDKIKNKLIELNITHSTIEFETNEEKCDNINCKISQNQQNSHHHHHHHH